MKNKKERTCQVSDMANSVFPSDEHDFTVVGARRFPLSVSYLLDLKDWALLQGNQNAISPNTYVVSLQFHNKKAKYQGERKKNRGPTNTFFTTPPLNNYSF